MNSVLIGLNVMRRILRELTSLGFIFLFPIIAAVLAVLMFGGTKTIKVGFANVPVNDYGLMSYMEKNQNYPIQLVDETELEELVNNKVIKYGVLFPEKIDQENKIKLVTMKPDDESLKLKGVIEDYLTAAIGSNPPDIDDIVGETGEEIQQAKLAIGMISMFIIMFIGTGMQLLLEDKRMKTFMRSFCAPLKEYELALGHLLANFFLGMLQIGIFLMVTTLIFQFNFGTSILNVFLLLLAFLITAIGLGIGIVGFISDGGKYNLVVTIIAVTMSFLGGAFFPLEYMSPVIIKLANLTPQKWLLEAFVKLTEGNNLLNIPIEISVLLLFGLVFFTFGVKTLKLSPADL